MTAWLPEAPGIIRVPIVEDHPGLHGLLRAEADLVAAGKVADGSDVLGAVARCRPDIALVDYRMPGQDGLLVCHRLTSAGALPRVIVYSAADVSELGLPARLAGAHGVVSKAAEVDELCGVLRRVGRGGHALPAIPVAKAQELAAALPPDQVPILGMAINSVPAGEIADVLRLTEDEVQSRLADMVRALSAGSANRARTPVGGARW